jgi:hypothetical protein
MPMPSQVPPWENMQVTITYTFGEGGRINFDNAPIQKPHFRLRGVYLPRSSGAILSRYAIDFDAGYMVPWWSGVQLFPLGSEPARLAAPLPPSAATPHSQQLYREALAPVRAELNKPDSALVRLEGYLGVLYPDEPRVDRVQMVYLPGTVHHPDRATSDVVYVQFNFADEAGVFHPLEDGGGTGPPH